MKTLRNKQRGILLNPYRFWVEPVSTLSPDIFSLQQFESYPLVDSVALTSTYQRSIPVSLGSPGAMIEGSTSAIMGDALMNGSMFEAYRNGYARSMYLAEPGFTVEIYLYREGGAVFDANTSWEWSGEIYFGREGTSFEEEQFFQFWWHGGQSWNGVTNIGMQMFGHILTSAGIETPLTLPDSVWTHVAWVVDGSEMRCYVAGQLVLTGAITGGPITTDHQFKFVTLNNYYGDSHIRAADDYRVTGRVLYTGGTLPPVGEPAFYIQDSFTDTDGVLLANHTGEVGATWTWASTWGSYNNRFEIRNNQLKLTAGADNHDELYVASGQITNENWSLEFGFIVTDNSYQYANIFTGDNAFGDGSGYSLVQVYSAVAASKINFSGGYIVFNAPGGIFTVGQEYIVRVDALGNALTYYVDEVLIGTHTAGASQRPVLSVNLGRGLTNNSRFGLTYLNVTPPFATRNLPVTGYALQVNYPSTDSNIRTLAELEAVCSTYNWGGVKPYHWVENTGVAPQINATIPPGATGNDIHGYSFRLSGTWRGANGATLYSNTAVVAVYKALDTEVASIVSLGVSPARPVVNATLIA